MVDRFAPRVVVLDEGMVYEYHPVNNDKLPVEYWIFRNLKTDTATYLAGQYYDHNFSNALLEQLMRRCHSRLPSPNNQDIQNGGR